MTDLTPMSSYAPTGLALPTDSRKFQRSPTGRAIARVQSQGPVRSVGVAVEEQLTGVKIAAASSIGRTAQTEVAFMSQMEAQLIQSCGSEIAAQRIHNMGNITAMGIAEMAVDGFSRLRRL